MVHTLCGSLQKSAVPCKEVEGQRQAKEARGTKALRWLLTHFLLIAFATSLQGQRLVTAQLAPSLFEQTPGRNSALISACCWLCQGCSQTAGFFTDLFAPAYFEQQQKNELFREEHFHDMFTA